jgi:signal transduction histidine kinase
MVESIAITKGIPVTVSVNKGLQIFADKNMIDSILRNLISNAIKFSNKGGKIKISAIESDHELHISVADHGVGILPGKLSAIFEIDKRTNTAGTENEMGTGLGLILCKDFVSRHQGKIWVKSTPGKGSTFTFSLPITKP